ncbi:SLATT domain-containing protein [Sphingomonas sp. DT-207]|uniref:SLATT domain-containing protein n=1 Tax=Sphingomonas sp. DT-207 TaxID=3396167 RepID=UPI003F19C325
MTNYNPVEKIYLTYKTRMTTEARLRRTGVLFHVMLAWYAFCSIILSFLDISQKFEIHNAGIVSAVASTAMFALSLFIYGERYSERASEFRSCYLKLQKLYESQVDAAQKMRKYAEILEHYENQADTDYDDMLFDAWWRGQALRNATGPVEISRSSFWKVLAKRAVTSGLLLTLFIAPVAVGIFWVRVLP